MACFAAYTGLRSGELAALTINQIDAATRVVTVDRKVIEVGGRLYVEAPKGRKQRRTIYPPGPGRSGELGDGLGNCSRQITRGIMPGPSSTSPRGYRTATGPASCATGSLSRRAVWRPCRRGAGPSVLGRGLRLSFDRRLA
jgi:integrase